MTTEHDYKPGTVIESGGEHYIVTEFRPGTEHEYYADDGDNVLFVEYDYAGTTYQDVVYRHDVDSVVSTPAEPDAPISFNEALIQLAGEHSREVQFKYAKGSDGRTIENRRLLPGNVLTTHGNKVVVGYDPDRDDVRAFRLDRIVGAVTT